MIFFELLKSRLVKKDYWHRLSRDAENEILDKDCKSYDHRVAELNLFLNSRQRKYSPNTLKFM